MQTASPQGKDQGAYLVHARAPPAKQTTTTTTLSSLDRSRPSLGVPFVDKAQARKAKRSQR